MSAIEQYFRDKSGVQPEEVAKEFLGEELVEKHSPGFFMNLLDILDRPGNATRALLVGKLGGLKGLIPFAGMIEDLTGLDIALNEDERVAGTEVIEKFFGRQRQRKGKIDPVDALGLLVEIVADPLWLVGGAGLTKVGKARQLLGSSIKGSMEAAKAAKAAGKLAEAAKHTKRASDLLRAVHKGTEGLRIPNKLTKAINTVSKTKGPTTLRSLSWAKQAARGERAALNVLGRPIIRGQKMIEKAEKVVGGIRRGVIGEKFLSATKRTELKHADLHDIFIKHKSAAQYEHGKRLGMLKKAQDNIQTPLSKKTGLSMGEIGELAARRAELGDAPQRYVKKSIEAAELGKDVPGLDEKVIRYANELEDIEKTIGVENMSKLEELAKTQEMAEDWLKEATDQGVAIHDVGGDLKYVPHIVTKEYDKATKGSTFRVQLPQSSGLGVYRGKAGKSREIMDMTRPEINEIIGSKAGAKQVFEGDLLTSLAEGSRQHMNRMTNAKTVRESVEKFGKKFTGAADEGYVSVPEIISKLEDAGVPTIEGLDAGKQIPMDVAQAVFNSFDQVIRKESDVMASNLWESGQRLLKGAYTVPFPAFHARNAFSNKVLNWLEGTWKPTAYIDSFNLQKAAAKTRKVMRTKKLDFMEAAKQVDWPTVNLAGVEYKGQELFDLADRSGILGRTIGIFDPEEVAGATFTVPKKGVKKALAGEDPLTQIGRGVGSTIEDHDRLAHFIDKMSDGYNAQDAAKSAKTALFDYGDLSEFEKKWMRDRFVFFYTFARKNLGQQSRKLLQQPAKQSLFSHLTGGTPRIQNEAKYRPDYANERLSVPTPFRNAEGNQYVVKSLGLPIEEAFGPLAAPGTGIWNRVSRLASRQLSRANPAITAATEAAFKKNLFFDKPITDPTEWAIQKTPAGRLYGTVKGFREGRDTLASKISGVTTGMRFNAPDPVKQKTYKIKQIARDYLASNKQAREFKRYYIPEGQEVDPMVQTAIEYQR